MKLIKINGRHFRRIVTFKNHSWFPIWVFYYIRIAILLGTIHVLFYKISTGTEFNHEADKWSDFLGTKRSNIPGLGTKQGIHLGLLFQNGHSKKQWNVVLVLSVRIFSTKQT